jgi:hypothetical protein
MKNTYYLGSAPADENCVQLDSGDQSSSERMQGECWIFLAQLERDYERGNGSPLPAGCKLKVQGQQHDFGRYYEVVLECDDTDNGTTAAALWLDWHASAEWDETSTKELIKKGLRK